MGRCMVRFLVWKERCACRAYVAVEPNTGIGHTCFIHSRVHGELCVSWRTLSPLLASPWWTNGRDNVRFDRASALSVGVQSQLLTQMLRGITLREAPHISTRSQWSVPIILGRDFVILQKQYLFPVQRYVCILFLMPFLVSWRVLSPGHLGVVKALWHRFSCPTCKGAGTQRQLGCILSQKETRMALVRPQCLTHETHNPGRGHGESSFSPLCANMPLQFVSPLDRGPGMKKMADCVPVDTGLTEGR
jgi:hypothetical protein